MLKNKSQNFMLGILLTLSLAHGMNDTISSIIISIYPLLKSSLNLSYSDIGLIALSYQMSSSIAQPIFGYVLDKKPISWFLPLGMFFTMLGIVVISYASTVYTLMGAVFLSGIGSAVIHPEASRITSLAAGNKRGLAQSIFQLGGTFGFSVGPLLAALFIREQANLAKFGILAILAMVVLLPACRWYGAKIKERKQNPNLVISNPETKLSTLPKKTIWFTFTILIFLVMSKNFYTVSFSNYYTFYLMSKFNTSLETSQLLLFTFLFSAAAGTLLGGPIGDKYGRRLVIWVSILGAAPFALLLPYANFECTVVLTVFIGFIMSSAFSAIIVYAQELFPNKVGFVSGVFFGLAFGVAGIASAILGKIADMYDINTVYHICSFIPLLGMGAYFLPRVRTLQSMKKDS